MGEGKSVKVDYEIIANLTKARFEFLRTWVNNAHKDLSMKRLAKIYHKDTGYSKNYAAECYTKLKPLLKAIKNRNFDIHYIRISFESIVKYFNDIESSPRKSSQNIQFTV